MERGRLVFLGIDLTTSEARASGCALLDENVSLIHLAAHKTDADILALAKKWRPSLVAIDSPLGLPTGMCCLEESCSCQSVYEFKGRVCERELLSRGISLYITTKKSFIKPMIYRAIKLADALKQQGYTVLEVYPYASKVCLFGKPIPAKNKREGMEFLSKHVGRLVPDLASYQGRLSHDLYDALMAAYTACLHSIGETESVGLEEEICIIVPARLDIP